jgi:hypothetical protein
LTTENTEDTERASGFLSVSSVVFQEEKSVHDGLELDRSVREGNGEQKKKKI